MYIVVVHCTYHSSLNSIHLKYNVHVHVICKIANSTVKFYQQCPSVPNNVLKNAYLQIYVVRSQTVSTQVLEQKTHTDHKLPVAQLTDHRPDLGERPNNHYRRK